MRESDSLLILGNQYKTIHIDKGTNQKQVLPMAAMCLSDQENMKVIFVENLTNIIPANFGSN